MFPSTQRASSSGCSQNESNLEIILAVAAFILFKFFLGWGWILSIILAFVVGGAVGSALDALGRK